MAKEKERERGREDVCEREKWAMLFQLSDCFLMECLPGLRRILLLGPFWDSPTRQLVQLFLLLSTLSLSLRICYNLCVSFCTLCFSVFIFVSLIALLVSFLLVWFGFCWKGMRNVVFSAVLSMENPSGKSHEDQRLSFVVD